MKASITIAMLAFNVLLFAQTKTEVILEEKLGTLDCKYQRSINTEKGDTLTYVSLMFRNMEYTQLIEYSSVSLNAATGSMEVYEMIQDLKAVQKEAAAKSDMRWDRNNYQLFMSSNFKQLYINTPNNNRQIKGWTMFPIKALPQLINWLNLVWLEVVEFEG